MKSITSSRRLIATCITFLLATATAQGTQIAVIDTGILPTAELFPYISSGGFDYGYNDADPFDDDPGLHGTIVSTIAVRESIANGSTGVEIVPIKVFTVGDGGSGATIEAVIKGIDHAVARPQIRVLNLSLGGQTIDNLEASAVRSAAQAGKVIVMAAGNESERTPTFPAAHVTGLSGFGVAVGALDPLTGNIALFSNRAGDAARYFLVANGNFGEPNEEGEVAAGTSFAAPRVAAAAGAILDRAPQLNGAQVVDILLRTAIDRGAPGIDDVYGWGELNIPGALAPFGPVAVPTGRTSDTTSSSGTSIGGAGALLLAGAIGYAVIERNKARMEEAMVLDSYGRSYNIDLTKMIEIRDSTGNLEDLFSSLNTKSGGFEVAMLDNAKLRFGYVEPEVEIIDQFDSFALRDAEDRERPTVMMSLHGKSAAFDYHFDYNTDPRNGFGALHLDGFDNLSFLSDRALTTPFLSFANRANSASLGYRLHDKLGLRFGVAATNENRDYGLDSDAAMLEGSFDVNDKATVKLHVGQLAERGSLLGGSNGGAFGVDRTNTTAVGITGQYRLSDSLALVGNYTEGYSRVDDEQNSLLHNFSGIRSHAFGLGLLANDLFDRGDRLGFSVSQPLRVTAGEVDMTVPYARDIPGNIYANTDRLDLTPSGSELDVEAYYQTRLGKKTRFGTYFGVTDEPFHAKSTDREFTLFTSVAREF